MVISDISFKKMKLDVYIKLNTTVFLHDKHYG